MKNKNNKSHNSPAGCIAQIGVVILRGVPRAIVGLQLKPGERGYEKGGEGLKRKEKERFENKKKELRL